MDVTQIDSSSIKRIEYTTSTDPNEDTGQVYGWVRATFMNGFRYMYKGVSLGTVVSIIESDSVGSAFNDMIVKRGYPYAKLELASSLEDGGFDESGTES